jgi:hypothetical protein
MESLTPPTTWRAIRSRVPVLQGFRSLIRSRRPCTAATRRCDFWNWGEDYVRPDCCTDHLLQMAVFLRDLMAREGIVHWVDFGSLLGAAREGRLISWDSDIDLGFLARDIGRLTALREEIEANGHELELDDPSVVRVNFSRRNRQHVDLYPWHLDDGGLRSTPDVCDWPGTQTLKDFPASFIDSLEEVTLEGEPFPAPSPLETFLVEHRYGPSFRVPMRPPTRRVHMLPELAPAEVTPAIEGLLQEIGRTERTLSALSFGRRGLNSPLWERWVDAGVPLRPRVQHVADRRAGLPAADRGPASDRLLELLDLLEQAVEERRHPTVRGISARTGRRIVRLLR